MVAQIFNWCQKTLHLVLLQGACIEIGTRTSVLVPPHYVQETVLGSCFPLPPC